MKLERYDAMLDKMSATIRKEITSAYMIGVKKGMTIAAEVFERCYVQSETTDEWVAEAIHEIRLLAKDEQLMDRVSE